jgi:hypothetical protein
MAIRTMTRPGVEIQQELAAISTTQFAPVLPTVLVGLNKQVIQEKSPGNYSGTSLTFAYPELELGAKVEPDSLVVRLDDAVLQVRDGGAVTCALSSDTLTIPGGTTFAASGVAAGDVVILTAAGVDYTAKILAVTGDYTLKLDRELTFASATFVIKRYLTAPQVVAAASLEATDESVTLAAELEVDGKAVLTAVVRVSYKAVRQLTVNAVTEVRLADFEAKLGPASVDNPLALAAQLALSNTITSVMCVGVEEDSPAAWLAALDALTNERVYAICLLTQDVTVQSFLKAHVQQMSVPEKSKFRIGFVNLPHPREKVVVEPLANGQLVRAAGVLRVLHPVAEFVTAVRVGDYVQVTARAEAPVTANPEDRAGIYRVSEVLNNGALKLVNAKFEGEEGSYAQAATVTVDFAAEAVDLMVFRVLDKQGQAEAIASAADSFGSRRIVYVTNGEIVVNVQGVDTVVPGYYLAAALAGMSAGNQPHQGFTNLGVLGVAGVRYANTYFTEEQLGLIAGSGGFVVEKQSPTALPRAYYQTTTDTTDTRFKELSVTKTWDYYSIGLKDRLASFIGPYNLYAATTAAIANVIEGYHQFLLNRVFPQIGAPILSGTLVSLAQNEFQRDVLDIVTEIDIPLPLNRIRARVVLTQ